MTSCLCMTVRPAPETCGHGELPSPPVFGIIGSPLLCSYQKTERLNMKHWEFFGQCFETLLALSGKLHTSHYFALPLIVCQQRLCCFSPLKSNKREKKIHYGSGLRGTSAVRTSGPRGILMRKGWAEHDSHVLSLLNNEWG